MIDRLPHPIAPKIIADSIDLAERHARYASPALEAMALEMGRQAERFAGEPSFVSTINCPGFIAVLIDAKAGIGAAEQVFGSTQGGRLTVLDGTR